MDVKRNFTIVPSLAEPVGELWQRLQSEHTRTAYFYVASPLSSTPLPVYDWIIQHKADFPNWDKVRFTLMDEMVEGDASPFHYISPDDSASYERFARQHFLAPLDKNVPILRPNLLEMQNIPPVDLLILALGVKGNYANVMPGTPIETGWHIAHLSPDFRQAHTNKDSKSYAGATFREYGMSLGPQQVLQAKHIAVIVSGKAKALLAKELLGYTAFDPSFPLSIVHHPSVKERVEFFMTDDVLGDE
jgi:6-phosphogluconolactonase/glucosamine-6-phosphate isomerase/deaminase